MEGEQQSDSNGIHAKNVDSFHGDSDKEKKRIMKNIILISVAFLMNFNAFQGLARLQSTLNLEDGIGKPYLILYFYIDNTLFW